MIAAFFAGAIFTTAALVVDITIRVFAVIYVPQNRKPQTAMAWLLAIFLIPYAGIILFLLVGSTRLPRRRREKQREISEYIARATEDDIDDPDLDPGAPEWLSPIVELNRTLGSMPLVGGNRAKLFTEYRESIAAMTAAVDEAERWVNVEFYILSLDATTQPFFDALEAAVKRGVTVRVLLDHVASLRQPGYLRTIRTLKRIGAKWHLMLPIQPWRGRYQRPDLRNHRKILVVDRKVAFTGSQNMIDRSYNKRSNIRRGLQWKDLMVKFEGPIVAGINALFVTDWYSETDELLLRESRDIAEKSGPALDAQVVPSGPGFDLENNLRLFDALVYSAQERVIITSPYFVPDDSMLTAITSAAYRGLDVQLFVSAVADQPVVFHAQRSYYEALLRAGVRIWLYRSPIVLHAKHFTIDDRVAVIGSSNMDMRSFSLNFEISVMLQGRELVDELRRIEETYRADSTELTLKAWLARPLRSKVLDNTARLTAAVQ